MKNFLIDKLLFSKAFYKKLTDKLYTLYLSFILVGVFNLSWSIISRIPELFFERPSVTFVYNASLALCVIILLGLIDVVFFAVPMFDIFKKFALRERISNVKGQLVKLMKIYIVSHFPIVPFALMLNWIYEGRIEGVSANVNVISIFSIMLTVWQCAIITRGIYVIYTFHQRLKGLVFAIVYTWAMLISIVISFLTNGWIVHLFK
ncbi:UNVERIFIED_CONTAM: hypothetical protein Cloal_0935 [Acetivibrio alkalicellulosi]